MSYFLITVTTLISNLDNSYLNSSIISVLFGVIETSYDASQKQDVLYTKGPDCYRIMCGLTTLTKSIDIGRCVVQQPVDQHFVQDSVRRIPASRSYPFKNLFEMWLQIKLASGS